MKLSGRKDVEAPAAYVFATLTDFEAWETFAMRRGADVSRTDSMAKPGPGMGWMVKFRFRGRNREASVRLVEMGAATVRFEAATSNVDAKVRLEVIEMGPKRCRLHAEVEALPKTLGARLFVQSLRLARNRVDRRFNAKLDDLAKLIQQRYSA